MPAGRLVRRMKDKPRIGAAPEPPRRRGGLFGREELRVIRPAVDQGLIEDSNWKVPCPPTLMVHARDGRFGGRGDVSRPGHRPEAARHAPGGERHLIVRTSVAGPAFDLAWQGRAEVGRIGIRVAVRLAASRKSNP